MGYYRKETSSFAPQHKPAAGAMTGQAGRGRNQMMGGGAMEAFGMEGASWGGANDMSSTRRQRGRQGGQQQGGGGVGSKYKDTSLW